MFIYGLDYIDAEGNRQFVRQTTEDTHYTYDQVDGSKILTR